MYTHLYPLINSPDNEATGLFKTLSCLVPQVYPGSRKMEDVIVEAEYQAKGGQMKIAQVSKAYKHLLY